MRQRYAVTLAANGRWPDTQAGIGVNLDPFCWVKIDNRGSHSVDVGLNANPNAGDQIDTLLTVSNAKVRVFNVAGQDEPDTWPHELHLVSAQGTNVVIELDDRPIVDLTFPT